MAIHGTLSMWPGQHPVGDPLLSQAAASNPGYLICDQVYVPALTWLCLLGHYRRNLAVRNAPSSGKGFWGVCNALTACGGPAFPLFVRQR